MATGTTAVRVLVADDQRLLTQALTVLLGTDERIQVVGQAHSGEEALELVEELKPDLVLMDLEMPGMTGVDATRLIRAAHPKTPVLILTGSPRREALAAAREAGAAGFLTKDSLSTEIGAAVLELAAFVGVSRG